MVNAFPNHFPIFIKNFKNLNKNPYGDNFNIDRAEQVVDYCREYIKQCERNMNRWFCYKRETFQRGKSDLGLPLAMDQKTKDDIQEAKIVRVVLLDRYMMLNRVEFCDFMNTEYDKIVASEEE